jgi:tetratricopeptide (TPR) repeat protein
MSWQKFDERRNRAQNRGPMAATPSSVAGRTPALAEAARLVREDPALAAERLRQIVQRQPALAEAHRLLGRALRAIGSESEAEEAELDAILASINDAELIRAGSALVHNDIPTAEALLRARLKTNPFDVAAIRMLAEVAARIGRFADAETLLRRALELAPGFTAARANLATVVHRQNRSAEALVILDTLLESDPDNAQAQSLKAAALGRTGSFEEAARLYRDVLARFPDQAKIWMSYGHVLKTIGRLDEGIAAYRRAIELAPTLGEVWWSLANLKTVRLDAADVRAMSSALEAPRLTDEDRFHLHFALGKALEDAGDVEQSFEHYAEGNRLRRKAITYDSREISASVQRSCELLTRPFFAQRDSSGCSADDPIFILGMPRAGSTLVEQILASHSRIEGTMELPDISELVKRFNKAASRGKTAGYPAWLGDLDSMQLAALGSEYLDRTRIQRKTDNPHFTDKMPNNWLHIGLIHLILPNARIVDVRRHPLACCFSNFKQHYARGQAFSYSQTDIGLYYSDYVRLLAHFDEVLPGRVHRVFYEALVKDPETEVRALLDYLGLPFEEACLRFHENQRAVRTASSEQVRQPINRQGLDQWQAFEPWLGPMKQALGDVLTHYPEVPAFTC